MLLDCNKRFVLQTLIKYLALAFNRCFSLFSNFKVVGVEDDQSLMLAVKITSTRRLTYLEVNLESTPSRCRLESQRIRSLACFHCSCRAVLKAKTATSDTVAKPFWTVHGKPTRSSACLSLSSKQKT